MIIVILCHFVTTLFTCFCIEKSIEIVYLHFPLFLYFYFIIYTDYLVKIFSDGISNLTLSHHTSLYKLQISFFDFHFPFFTIVEQLTAARGLGILPSLRSTGLSKVAKKGYLSFPYPYRDKTNFAWGCGNGSGAETPSRTRQKNTSGPLRGPRYFYIIER